MDVVVKDRYSNDAYMDVTTAFHDRYIDANTVTGHSGSQRYMKSEEFSNLARIRNGVETVPASFRKNYHLDRLPRGKQREKIFFGSKTAALNFRKLFGFRKGLGNYAKNPVLA